MQFKAQIFLISLLFLFPSMDMKKVVGTKLFANTIETSIDEKVNSIYNALDDNGYSLPNFISFTEAIKGYFELKGKGVLQKNILTIIDFSLPSSFKRLWVIDLDNNIVLYNSLVAHGSGSGNLFAYSFSNALNSSKSSLGFYTTGEIYYGNHGLSLKLDGLEKGINSNARNRGIVIHGADYASATILKSQHYLGRSQGCPALPMGLSRQIITTIKNKSCLFIYHPSREYYKSKSSVFMS